MVGSVVVSILSDVVLDSPPAGDAHLHAPSSKQVMPTRGAQSLVPSIHLTAMLRLTEPEIAVLVKCDASIRPCACLRSGPRWPSTRSSGQRRAARDAPSLPTGWRASPLAPAERVPSVVHRRVPADGGAGAVGGRKRGQDQASGPRRRARHLACPGGLARGSAAENRPSRCDVASDCAVLPARMALAMIDTYVGPNTVWARQGPPVVVRALRNGWPTVTSRCSACSHRAGDCALHPCIAR